MIEKSFESVLQNNMLNSSMQEKTNIDKIMARQDADRVREIVRKEELQRSDISELRDLLASPEMKMLSYDDWKWYVQLKFYSWVTEVIKMGEMIFDYEFTLKERYKKNNKEISDNIATLLRNNRMMVQFCIKLMVEVYLNIGRSSLSIGATGFLEPMRNKWSMEYSGDSPFTPRPVEQQPVKKKGLFGW